MTRLLFTLEANVHARLGYFPPEFRETCREHITAHLRALELHLNAELVAVQHSLRELGVQQHSGNPPDGYSSSEDRGEIQRLTR